jgi:hypothetical protein
MSLFERLPCEVALPDGGAAAEFQPKSSPWREFEAPFTEARAHRRRAGAGARSSLPAALPAPPAPARYLGPLPP